MGIICGTKKKKATIILYFVNNSHWIPGTKTLKPTNKIPKEYIHIENILPIKNIIDKLHSNNKNNNIVQNNLDINNYDSNIINLDKNDLYTLNTINDKQESNIKEQITDNEDTPFSTKLYNY